MKGLELLKFSTARRAHRHRKKSDVIGHAGQVIVGDVISNRADRYNLQLRFFANLPTDSTIHFTLINTNGVVVTDVEPMMVSRGEQVIDWLRMTSLCEGIYSAKIEIRTGEGTFAFWRKVVV